MEIGTNREVAVKQMVLARQRSKQLTLNEICSLKHIKSDKIISLYDAYYSHCALEGKSVFDENCKFCLFEAILRFDTSESA